MCTHRSSSIKPSIRSSRSRLTLLGSDTEFENKIGGSYNAPNNVAEFGCVDHILAAFCIRRRGKIIRSSSVRPEESEHPESHFESPWVRQVYVLSGQRDENRHLIPKEAKCTIDTGNLQGNIVSRAFVVDVLKYTESHFQPLTKLEEDGGTGVAGHKLVPQGAINLTWFHNNSTRVFRDMRFLISEHPMYDLIIGARSIQENNILDVPNLMTGRAGGIQVSDDEPTSTEVKELENTRIAELEAKNEKGKEKLAERLRIGKGNTSDLLTKLTKEHEALIAAFHDAEKKYKAADSKLRINDILKSETKQGKEATELRNKFEARYPEVPLLPFGKKVKTK